MSNCEIVIPLKYLTENEADLCLNYPDNIPREKITKFYNRYFWLEKLREVYGDNSIDIAMSKIKKNKEAVSKFSSPLSGKNLPFSSLSDQLDDKKKNKDTNYDKYQTTPTYLEVTKRF